MARRVRDYAAEQRRRNELARQRGFTSRGQQRRRIEAGKAPAIAPRRIRSPRTKAAQDVYNATQLNKYRKAGFPSEYAYRKAKRECEDYAAAHAHRQIARYDPDVNAPGIDRRVYCMAYHRAFVQGTERYGAVRRSGGSEALRNYFVDITEYYAPDEYEVRYGHDSPIVRRR